VPIIVDKEENGTPTKQKKKVGGAVDKFLADEQICISNATVHIM